MTKSNLKSILSYVLIAILIFTTTPGGSAEESSTAIPTGTVPYTFDVDWGDLKLIPIGAEFKVSISEKHSGKVHTKIATHNTGWNCTFYLDPNLEYEKPRVQTYAFYPAIEKTSERQYKIAVNAHNLGEYLFHHHWKTLTFEVQGDVTSKEDSVQITITPKPLYGAKAEPHPITVTITKENNWTTSVLVPSQFLIENTGSYGYYSYENEGIVPQAFPDLDSVVLGHYENSTHFVVEYKPGNGSNSYDMIYSMLEPQPTPPAYPVEFSTNRGDGHSNDNSGNSDQNDAQNNDPSNNRSSNQGDGMNSGNSGSGSTGSGNSDSASTNGSSSSEVAQTPSTPPTTTTSSTIATTTTTGTTTASTTASSTSAATAASSNLSTAVSESTMQSLKSNRDVSEDDEEYEYVEGEEFDLEEIDENDPARGTGKRRKKKTSNAAVGNATTASGLDAVAANVTALPYTANLPNELFFAVGAFLSVLGLLGIFLEKLRC